MPSISIITPIAAGKWAVPHTSQEAVEFSAASVKMPCFLGKGLLVPTLQMTGKPTPTLQGQKVVTANSKLSISHMVTPVNPLYNEYGGIDHVITLFSKPASNTLVFDYDSVNLQPFLQPPLTAQDIAEGAIRPDHVINSLAWYHTSKGGMVTPSDVASRITTGKAQHWYRQVVTDSKGSKSWADWTILNASQVGLVLDDKFMAAAVYPIVISPVGDTFGYTTAGISSVNSQPNVIKTSGGDTFNGVAGTGTNMKLYASQWGGTSNAQMAVYDAASPSNLIANAFTDPVSINNTARWWTANFTSTPTFTATPYYVVFNEGGAAADFKSYFDASTNNTKSIAITFGTWPSTITWGNSGVKRQFSVYVTYTAGGGATNTNVSCAIIFGDLVSASRRYGGIRTSSVLLGDLVSASRSFGTIRSAAVLIGQTVSASKIYGVVRSAAVLIGQAVSASRIVGYIRNSAITMGQTVSASRVAGYIRSAAVSIGQTVTASRVIGFARSASVIIGQTVTATRTYGAVIASSIIFGCTVTASRLANYIRSASVAIGDFVDASYSVVGAAVNYTRTCAIEFGQTVSASRLAAYIRSAAITIGQGIAASRLAAYTRAAAVAVGSVVSALFGRLYRLYMTFMSPLRSLLARSPARSFTVHSPDRNLTVRSREY